MLKRCGYLDDPRWKWNFNMKDFYSFCLNKGDAIESPEFKINMPDDGKELEWLLRFYPKGTLNSEKECDHGSIMLVSLNKNQVWVRFKLLITMISCNGWPNVEYEYDTRAEGKFFFYRGCQRGDEHVRNFLNSLSLLTSAGNPLYRFEVKLNVSEIKCKNDGGQLDSVATENDHNKCTLLSLKNVSGDRDVEPKESEIVCKCNVKQNQEFFKTERNQLLKIIQDGSFGDVSIFVDGKKFRAHRVLLSSQSEKLAKIFDNYTCGQRNASVTIDDVNHQVFAEILRFIYFNEIQEIGKYAKGLFAVAEKYSMQALSKFCEEEVSKNVTCENAIEYLDLVDQFDLEELKKVVIEFVASNFKIISKSSSFASLENMKSSLLFELIQVMGSRTQ
ncbi:hypothetical protein QAD02_011044 [Eretmocerus hayati]|uniref:Uncharacterized protein n=1 Tax=Eretmocerus hayati TaxID=131215 RepID=A0ACC2NWM2_9HYME|nr:hypothetical protein QAD02_011044 [Eretmocerus hayati]